MTEPRKSAVLRRRPERLIDPYVVMPHTWTRAELLEARRLVEDHPVPVQPHVAV